MVLERTDSWPVRDKEPEAIDTMAFNRVANLIAYLESRYRMTEEEKRNYGMVEKSPLYRSLQSRLPIALDEHAAKVGRKIARGTQPPIQTAPIENRGLSLDELNKRAGTGVHPVESPAPVSTKSWLNTEDVATVLDLTIDMVRTLAKAGQIPGAEKINRPGGGRGGTEWRFPTEEITKLKERRAEPKKAAATERAKKGAAKSNEVQTAKREEREKEAAKAAPPIIKVLKEMHDSIAAGIHQLAANDQAIIDGTGKLLEDLAKAVAEHIDNRTQAIHDALVEHLDGTTATLKGRIEQIADNQSDQLDRIEKAISDNGATTHAQLIKMQQDGYRIEELARTSAENTTVATTKKGKR